MIKSSWARWMILSVLVLAGATGLAACGGGSSASQEEIAKAEKHGREERQEKEKERKLEREIQKLKTERQEEKKRKREKGQTPQPNHGATTPAPEPPPSSTPSGTDCGEGVVAGPETSCGFALETRNEYETYIGSGPGEVEAYSAANETWYWMNCTGAPHACSGAISATVYFP